MQTTNLDYEGMWVLNVNVISLPYIFQVLYVLCFTRPRYHVSIGPLVFKFYCLPTKKDAASLGVSRQSQRHDMIGHAFL